MRKFILALALVAALLVPGTALAAGSTARPIHISVSAPIYGATGSCADLSTYAVMIGQPGPATIGGVVTDSGPINVNLGLNGPFPRQLAGQIEIVGAHSHATLAFTGGIRCDDGVNARVSGFVWQGTLTNTATRQTWSITGSGRDNLVRANVTGGVFSMDFEGLARP